MLGIFEELDGHGSTLSHAFHLVVKGLSAYVNKISPRAVVMAQLVGRLLPTPQICRSNPNIGTILSKNSISKRKDEYQEKEAGNGPS